MKRNLKNPGQKSIENIKAHLIIFFSYDGLLYIVMSFIVIVLMLPLADDDILCLSQFLRVCSSF
jgi:hypothetical protein